MAMTPADACATITRLRDEQSREINEWREMAHTQQTATAIAELERDVQALNRALSALTEQRWQPIETAPKDHPILVSLISDGCLRRVSYANFCKIGFYEMGNGDGCHWATHWAEALPLPTPPAKETR